MGPSKKVPFYAGKRRQRSLDCRVGAEHGCMRDHLVHTAVLLARDPYAHDIAGGDVVSGTHRWVD